MRAAIILAALLAVACAEVAELDDVEQVSERTQAATTQPWYPSGVFTQSHRYAGQYGGSTREANMWQWSQWLYLPNTEYELRGMLQSGDDTTFTMSSVSWSLTFGGYSNQCVLKGCVLYLCLNDDYRGWGTCTQVLPQGGTSWTMTWAGSTGHFAGLKHRAYETLRWTMVVQTPSNWETQSIINYKVTVYGSP